MLNQHRQFGVALIDYWSDKLLDAEFDKRPYPFSWTLKECFESGDFDQKTIQALYLYWSAEQAQLEQEFIPYRPAGWDEALVTAWSES